MPSMENIKTTIGKNNFTFLSLKSFDYTFNRLKIFDLAKTGIFINFGAILLVTLFTYFFGTYIFDIDLSTMPSWAIP